VLCVRLWCAARIGLVLSVLFPGERVEKRCVSARPHTGGAFSWRRGEEERKAVLLLEREGHHMVGTQTDTDFFSERMVVM
jgi:hypothetical protein